MAVPRSPWSDCMAFRRILVSAVHRSSHDILCQAHRVCRTNSSLPIPSNHRPLQGIEVRGRIMYMLVRAVLRVINFKISLQPHHKYYYQTVWRTWIIQINMVQYCSNTVIIITKETPSVVPLMSFSCLFVFLFSVPGSRWAPQSSSLTQYQMNPGFSMSPNIIQ